MLLLRVMAPSASTHTHIQYMWVRLGCFYKSCKKAQERLRKRTEPPCGVCWVSVMCWEATGANVDSVIPLESDHVQIPSWFIFVNTINWFTRVNKIMVICVIFPFHYMSKVLRVQEGDVFSFNSLGGWTSHNLAHFRPLRIPRNLKSPTHPQTGHYFLG